MFRRKICYHVYIFLFMKTKVQMLGAAAYTLNPSTWARGRQISEVKETPSLPCLPVFHILPPSNSYFPSRSLVQDLWEPSMRSSALMPHQSSLLPVLTLPYPTA